MTFSLRPITFDWRPATDAQLVHALHLAGTEGAPPGMVRPDPLSHFEQHMGPCGQTIGCFLDSGEMVAYGVLGLQSATVEQLAGLLGAERARFCVLDGAAALGQWRGFGLHYAAVVERIRYAATLERTQIAATVAPENVRSMRGLFRAGMTVQSFAVLYGGLPRLVLQMDTLALARTWRHAMRVALVDHVGHQRALASELTGYECLRDAEGNWVVEYGL